ncbi:ABC transporter, substrate-binding protein (cluster 1, maltose/g3p/polyamine/iron) [hydrothermal vent metagenome]|uniref:ABC transporter, substrate-binding protein (Cluster 1, maltose/g3p/polyamine/iron) n=1 Tax=hydrothermal vent metagenome TaxID=652676 RepID=A0A3B0TMU4_9ZZZZ
MSLRKMTFKLAVALTVAGLAAPGAMAQSGDLMLYTSQPDKKAAKTVEAFREVYPDVKVTIFRSGTVEVMSKLAAEFAGGGSPADVLLIADAANMESLKAGGKLYAYTDFDTSGYRAGVIDDGKTYFGTKLITTGIAFNTKAAERPTSWAELMGDKYKGQIAMPSPLYSGAAALMLSTIVARDDLGWKFYETLANNGAVAVRGNGAVLKSVAGGEKSYGIIVDFMALNEKKKGAPIDFVFPKEGVPAVTEPVAIIASTGNLEAAKAFVDFLMSDKGQKLAVAQGFIPAKEGMKNPDWLPEGTPIKLMPIDTNAVLANGANDKKRFAEIFGG